MSLLSRVTARSVCRLAVLQMRQLSSAVAEQSAVAVESEEKPKIDLSQYRSHNDEDRRILEQKYAGYKDEPITEEFKPSGVWLFVFWFILLGYTSAVFIPGGKIDQWFFGVRK